MAQSLKLPLNGILPSFRSQQQTGRSKWALTNPSLVPLSPPELRPNPQPQVRCAKLYPADRVGTILRDEARHLSGLPTFHTPCLPGAPAGSRRSAEPPGEDSGRSSPVAAPADPVRNSLAVFPAGSGS